MHYAYINDKRVSRHAMKDCRTFLKLQEAVGPKQAEARRQGYDEKCKQCTSSKSANDKRSSTRP
jgi:hypothetical protein